MANKTEDFNLFVDRAMDTKERAHMRPAVAKELLHYDILFSLDKNNLLDKLTFQGGTCLRLCYGAQRLSEDLDFVGGKDFTTVDLIDIKVCLEKYIGERYGLEITVKEPKEMAEITEKEDIKIDKWQIRVTTSPERKDLPKQKIKLEIANIPAYSRIPKALQENYDVLPDGYSDMLVISETLDEIMADKLISLVSCQRYIRHRDIWDLRWLKQQGATINPEYIVSKIRDYRVDDYPEKLNEMVNRLEEIIRGKDFQDEMSRFIPVDVQERTLQKNKFIDFLINENQTMLLEVKKIVSR